MKLVRIDISGEVKNVQLVCDYSRVNNLYNEFDLKLAIIQYCEENAKASKALWEKQTGRHCYPFDMDFDFDDIVTIRGGDAYKFYNKCERDVFYEIQK